MEATDLLNIPNDEKVSKILINMSHSEKVCTFNNLLNNFKNTYKNGTTYFTLLTLSHLLCILNIIVEKRYHTFETKMQFRMFNHICVKYIDFAKNEILNYANIVDELKRIQKLFPHADILPLAIEYCYPNLVEYLKCESDENQMQYIQEYLQKINSRYFEKY